MSVTESMTRVKLQWGYHLFTVRVWRDEEEVKAKYFNDDITRTVEEFSRKPNEGVITSEPPIPELVHRLSVLPRVAAVEVVDEHGHGVVRYVVWP